MDLECQVLETFVTGRHHLYALKYFLEVENIVMSDWTLLEDFASQPISKQLRFYTETIHKISLSLMVLTNSFEAVLVYQLVKLRDPQIKEMLHKILQFLKLELGIQGFQKELNKAIKHIWRIDLLNILVIAANNEPGTSQIGVLKKIKQKKSQIMEKQKSLGKSCFNKHDHIAVHSNVSEHSSEEQSPLKKENPKTQSDPNAAEIKATATLMIENSLVERMEALDLEEEEFEEKEESKENQWSSKYHKELKEHLKSVIKRHQNK